ncbi:TetR family transcriptional regulator, partial [Lentzea sp. BCCO 10_0856]|nr:TetR family transcriptional regulator [Lentzea sp. BCCO 10_0856]
MDGRRACIGVNREWPVDLSRMTADQEAWARRNRAVDEVEVFIQRAVDERFLRAGQPPGWMGAVPGHPLHLGGQQLLDHDDAQAV